MFPHKRNRPAIRPIAVLQINAVIIAKPSAFRKTMAINETMRKIKISSGPGTHPQSDEPLPFGIYFFADDLILVMNRE